MYVSRENRSIPGLAKTNLRNFLFCFFIHVLFTFEVEVFSRHLVTARNKEMWKSKTIKVMIWMWSVAWSHKKKNLRTFYCWKMFETLLKIVNFLVGYKCVESPLCWNRKAFLVFLTRFDSCEVIFCFVFDYIWPPVKIRHICTVPFFPLSIWVMTNPRLFLSYWIVLL